MYSDFRSGLTLVLPQSAMRILGAYGEQTRIGELVNGVGSARAKGQALRPGLILKKFVFES